MTETETKDEEEATALAINKSADNASPVALTVPHNLEIEAALISALMRDNKKFEDVADIVTPDCFYSAEHRLIFEKISDLINAGKEASLTTLQHLFENDPLLGKAGGLSYLAELATNVLIAMNSLYYAEVIRELYQKRMLINVGEDVVRSAYDMNDLDNTANKQIEAAEEKLYALAEHGDYTHSTEDLGAATKRALQQTQEAFKRRSHVVGVTTGFLDIDNMLGGLHPSDLLILAGRPSMGKTALATNIAFNAAAKFSCKLDEETGKEIKEGGRVLFFSLEMSSEQLAQRILAEQASVSSDKMRRGQISNEEFEKIAHAANIMSKTPLYIDDTPALSVTGMRQRARRLQRKSGLDLIIVDYLQLLQPPTGKRYDGRVQEVSDITRHLKTIAKELKVPILALSQLSREVEKREDKRPQLSDLRESGSIEQDADVVSFIFRPEYYLSREAPEQRDHESDDKYVERLQRHEKKLEESRNITQVIIAKQRHGPVGTIELFFDANLTRFTDMDRQHQELPH